MAAKKTSAKKPTKKKAPAKKKQAAKRPAKVQKESGAWPIVLTIVVVLAVIALITFIFLELQASQESKEVILATVNGQPIYESEVDAVYSRLPVQYQAQFSKSEILNQTITEVLILQYASDEGIQVTSGEVDYRIAEMVASSGISEQMLQEQLDAQNVTREEFEEYVRRLLVLEQLQERIPQEVDVTIQEIQRVYADRLDQYQASPEDGELRVRHILVETEDEAWEVVDALNDGGDFVELARENSIGPTAPTGGDLGVISNESPLVEEFKVAALELEEVGDFTVPVQTQFGWHVIYRDEDIIPLDDVRDEIENELRNQKAQQYFAELLTRLRDEAEIVYVNPAQ